MLPGKQYSLDDVALIAWRHRWKVLIPFVIAVLVGAVYARSLPNVYESSATILVVPQQVPESFVPSTVTGQINQRLQAISQQILSSARLEQLIRGFDLYAEARETVSMDMLIQRMRQDVTIVIEDASVRGRRARRDGGSSFTVSFRSTDPNAALRVTERLASLFVEENLRDREVLAEGTDQFLDTQVADARSQLARIEAEIEQYRRENIAQLPTMQSLRADSWRLINTQQAIDQVRMGLRGDGARRLMLERMIEELDAELRSGHAPARSVGLDGDLPAGSSEEQLQAARNLLASLEVRLTPDHPDVGRARRTVAELEAQVEEDALRAGGTTRSGRALTTTELQQRTRLAELRAELETLDRQTAARWAEVERLERQRETQASRIDALPRHQAALALLARDRDILQAHFRQLMAKKEDSRIAATLERQQIGEQFRIIEPARLPARPSSPNRRLVNLIVAMLGLGFGVGLVALSEYRGTSLRTGEEVVLALSLPVVALIPRMVTSLEQRRRKRRRRAFAAAATLACVAGSGLAWAFISGQLPWP